MTGYTLSVVQLCQDAHKLAAEQVAESAGYGIGNLSVQLKDASNGIWWGCHAWWIPSSLAAASALPPEAPAEWHAAMAAVITRVIETKDMTPEERDKQPEINFAAARTALGLSVVDPLP